MIPPATISKVNHQRRGVEIEKRKKKNEERRNSFNSHLNDLGKDER